MRIRNHVWEVEGTVESCYNIIDIKCCSDTGLTEKLFLFGNFKIWSAAAKSLLR